MSHINLNLHIKAIKDSVEYLTGIPDAVFSITLHPGSYDSLREEYDFYEDLGKDCKFVINNVELVKGEL